MENKPRYSIVRVDNSCWNTFNPCLFGKIFAKHKKCKDCRYGDTKEQLIRKVAQALTIETMERYRRAPNCEVNQTIAEHVSRICLEQAQFVVEFLGVEE